MQFPSMRLCLHYWLQLTMQPYEHVVRPYKHNVSLSMTMHQFVGEKQELRRHNPRLALCFNSCLAICHAIDKVTVTKVHSDCQSNKEPAMQRQLLPSYKRQCSTHAFDSTCLLRNSLEQDKVAFGCQKHRTLAQIFKATAAFRINMHMHRHNKASDIDEVSSLSGLWRQQQEEAQEGLSG